MNFLSLSPGLRKSLAFGAGLGIEIGRKDLRIAIARVRPSGARVIHAATMERFRERPAAEWGREYSEMLKRAGANHLAATVLIPRSEVIVRQLTLAGVPDKDLAAAIGFQVDSLHPFGEGEAAHAWARLTAKDAVLIGIARRETIDAYSELFTEAGVKVASFSFSAAVLYGGVRLLSTAPARGFLTGCESEDGIEVYGESAARPVLSAVFDVEKEKAAALAESELRLEAHSNLLDVHEVLPKPLAAPKEYESARYQHAYAAALASACPRLALPANLLPAERRSTSSRAMFIPTAVLAAALVLVVAALASIAPIEDRRYVSALEAEIAQLEPLARRSDVLDRTVETLRARTRLLDSFRSRSKADLDALQELTSVLPPNAWVMSMEVTRSTVTANGEAEQAAAVLKLIDSSPLFEKSEFTTAIGRGAGGELFGIRAQREGLPK